MRTLRLAILLGALAGFHGCGDPDPPVVEPIRVATLTLGGEGHDIIGPILNRETLESALAQVDPANPDIIVLIIDSPGGMVAALPGLSDLIHHDLEPEYRVVAWVRRAASAAALVALTCDEIVMMPDGILGGVVTWEADDDGLLHPLDEEDALTMLEIGREVAERGGYPPEVVHAMQEPVGLSRQVDEWMVGELGPELVCPQGEILVFNALTAGDAGISLGVAGDMTTLMSLLEVSNWEPVAPEADAWLATQLADANTALHRAREIRSSNAPEHVAELKVICEQHPWIARELGLPTEIEVPDTLDNSLPEQPF